MAIHEHWLTEEQFQAAVQHLDDLVREFEELPVPDIQEKVFDLLQTVDAVHRAGLQRLIALLNEQGQAALIERAAADPVVRTLLLLYDQIPTDERTQAETALEAIRPYLHSHGGEVEVLDVVNGVVHVRLSGACYGCVGSATTLKRGVEAALRAGFPGFRGMEVHAPEPPAPKADVIPLIQAGQEPPRPVRRPIFQPVARLADLPDGTMQAFDVADVRVLVANVGGEIYAVRNTCPGSMAPLNLGTFTPPIVVCPWHNEAYDIRTGKRADGQSGPGLTVLPIAVVGDTIQVAVNTIEASA